MKRRTPQYELAIPITKHYVINRGEEELRIVEGYAFVNEVVDGEGGVRLRRSAMESATPDHARWGNVREMHRASAVGTAKGTIERVDGEDSEIIELGIVWDDRGAFYRCRVVDDKAWEKVQAGVYQAFSVGVRPTVMRGKDVVACTWIETSLVDRPKDVDTAFTIARFDGATEEDVEIEMTDELRAEIATMIRAKKNHPTFADFMGRQENRTLRSVAIGALSDSLYNVLVWDDVEPEERAAVVKSTLKEFESYVMAKLERGELDFVAEAAPQELARCEEGFESFDLGTMPQDGLILTRIEARRIQKLIGDQVQTIERLENTPRTQAPIRFTRAIDRAELERQLLSTTQQAETEIQDEYQRLQSLPADSTEAERRAAVARMQVLRLEAASLGISLTS